MKSQVGYPQAKNKPEDLQLLLCLSVIIDCGLACGVDVSQDLVYVRRRFGREGLSFLTITLPKMATFIERATKGKWTEPQGFRLCKGRKYPAFLQGFTEQVLEPNGKIRSDACQTAFWAVRQISRFFKKIEIDCTPERVDAAISKFIQTDEEVRRHVPCDSDFRRHWKRVCGFIVGYALAELDDALPYAFIPRHGNGAVYERLIREEKYAHAFWPSRLVRDFPASQFWIKPELGLGIDRARPKSRLATVPKDQEKPRIIAVEPVMMQWCQQALMQRCYSLVENSWLNNHIGFRDQTRNQDWARKGSIDGCVATLDLSEASDRVHPSYVVDLFSALPNFRRRLFATRTPLIDVNGANHVLAKFATMGSAMCFPVQTLLFFTIALASATWDSRDQISLSSLKEAARTISVFGDDIIVPAELAAFVSARLVDFGFKVNEDKSFAEGPFRESCGGDYFKGGWVTPIYLRSLPPTGRKDAHQVTSWLATANLLHTEAGLWLTADLMRSVVEDVTGKLPITRKPEGYMSWISFCGEKPLNKGYRFNKDLQCFEFRGITSSPKTKESHLGQYDRLLRNLLWTRTPVLPGLDEPPSPEVFDRPYSARLRQKWFCRS